MAFQTVSLLRTMGRSLQQTSEFKTFSTSGMFRHTTTGPCHPQSNGEQRERETPVTSLTSRWNREWSCIWLPRRCVGGYASTRFEPVECSNFEVHVKTRSLALERSIEQQDRVTNEWRWGSGSFAFAGQTAVDHAAAFRWHASSKKNRPSWCLFLFRMATVLPWEQLG